MDAKDEKLILDGFQSSKNKDTLQAEWDKIHDNLRNNELLQRLQLQIAQTDEGREAMALQRREWAKHELPAPFDFLFEGKEDRVA